MELKNKQFWLNTLSVLCFCFIALHLVAISADEGGFGYYWPKFSHREILVSVLYIVVASAVSGLSMLVRNRKISNRLTVYWIISFLIMVRALFTIGEWLPASNYDFGPFFTRLFTMVVTPFLPLCPLYIEIVSGNTALTWSQVSDQLIVVTFLFCAIQLAWSLWVEIKIRKLETIAQIKIEMKSMVQAVLDFLKW